MSRPCDQNILSRISIPFGMLSVCTGQVTHALLTRPPLTPKGSLDLHVLGTPPAFILSQDQTLNNMFITHIFRCLYSVTRMTRSASLLCV